MSLVFHFPDVLLQQIEIQPKLFGFCLDLDPSEQPEIALYRRKGEIRAQRECDGKEGEGANRWRIASGHVGVACMLLLKILFLHRLFRCLHSLCHKRIAL